MTELPFLIFFIKLKGILVKTRKITLLLISCSQKLSLGKDIKYTIHLFHPHTKTNSETNKKNKPTYDDVNNMI